MKVLHILFGILLAQIPILILAMLLGSLSLFIQLVLIVSLSSSIIFGLLLIFIFIKLKFLNVYSILVTSIIVVLPFIYMLSIGFYGLYFLLPSISGGVVFWLYLIHSGILEIRHGVSGIAKLSGIATVVLLIYIPYAMVLSYEINDSDQIGSYQALDQEMIKAMDKYRQQLNDKK